MVLAAALVMACDDESGTGNDDTSVADSSGQDTRNAEDTTPPEDTTEPQDTTESDTTPGDTGSADVSDTGEGDTSSGDTNTGDTNTGDTNVGDTNVGDTNTGDTNVGDTNTGDTNVGDTNVGDTNTGDTNVGDTAGTDTSGPTGDPPAAGELVIVEIQGNPNALVDDDAEYIEVLNVSGKSLDLNGVTVAYHDWPGGEPARSSATFTFTESIVVADGERALLARSSNTTLNGGITPDAVYDTVLVTNSASRDARIRLYTASWSGNEPPAASEIIDAVPIPAATFENTVRGRAWQLDPGQVSAPTAADNDTASNWCQTVESTGTALEYATGNFGTPGTDNQCN